MEYNCALIKVNWIAACTLYTVLLVQYLLHLPVMYRYLKARQRRYFKVVRSPGINSASLCTLAGRYDNPIPTPFLAPIDSFKIPALVGWYDNPTPTPFLAPIVQYSRLF